VEGRSQAIGEFRLGSTATLALAGQKPRQVLAIHVYRHTSGRKDLYNTTIPVRADQEGEAIYRLRTRTTDPPGCYTILMQPGEIPDSLCFA
jgi:hypothetical protein